MDGNLPPVTSEMVFNDVRRVRRARPRGFVTAKRVFDVVGALLALPVVGLIGLALILLNPIWNRGPLLYATAEPDSVKAAQARLGIAEAGKIVEQTLAHCAVARQTSCAQITG